MSCQHPPHHSLHRHFNDRNAFWNLLDYIVRFVWSVVVFYREAPEASYLFLMLFSLQWLMRQHPKVNTCPFGWRIHMPNPLPFSIFQCIVRWQINKSGWRRSLISSLHTGDPWLSVSQSNSSPITSAESHGLWISPHIQKHYMSFWTHLCVKAMYVTVHSYSHHVTTR